jgi:hypothetical protein
MDSRLDVSTGQKIESITCIDRYAPVEGLGPLPVSRGMFSNLQRCHRLAEQESDGPQICVSVRPEAVGELLDFLVGELGVFHVAEVGLVMGFPFVHLGEKVRG